MVAMIVPNSLSSVKPQQSGGAEPRQMQLICLRTIPFIEAESLRFREAKEALFRDAERGFLLYLSKDDVQSAPVEERVIPLAPREALIWLNEHPEDQGSFWA
jgi:hypothetical protein